MKKGSKIALGIIIPIGVIVASLLVITENTVCTLSTSKINDHTHFFRDADASTPMFRDQPITKISMLGSHDALSNDINYWSAPNSSEDNIVNNFGLRLLAKGLMVRLAKAQQHNIYDQLCAGVRYIDARITYINGNYYTSHGLVSNTLEYNLNLILKFLYENPGEFILFNINNYYPGESSFQELVDYIASIKYENKNLYDYINYSNTYTHFYELTYGNVTADSSKAGVVLFSDQSNLVYPFNQFSVSEVRDHWHDLSSSTEIITKIKEEAEYCKNLDYKWLKINQTQQTPSFSEVGTMILNWSLLHEAKYHNVELLNDAQIDEIIDAIPIYMVDYSTSDYQDFNNRIIEKLTNRNKNL